MWSRMYSASSLRCSRSSSSVLDSTTARCEWVASATGSCVASSLLILASVGHLQHRLRDELLDFLFHLAAERHLAGGLEVALHLVDRRLLFDAQEALFDRLLPSPGQQLLAVRDSEAAAALAPAEAAVEQGAALLAAV